MALPFGYLSVAAHRVFPAAPMCYGLSAVGAIVKSQLFSAFSPMKDTLPVSRKTEQIARGFFGGGSLGLFNFGMKPNAGFATPIPWGRCGADRGSTLVQIGANSSTNAIASNHAVLPSLCKVLPLYATRPKHLKGPFTAVTRCSENCRDPRQKLSEIGRSQDARKPT
jgi:hypothetical protein